MTPIVDRLRAALSVSYEVERELASGGMGTIFLARDIALDRKVAVKILRPELATAVAAERFLREARILASLSHPNVLPVHHAGEAGGFFYYVMDHVEGETLQQRLARGPMPVEEVIKLGSDLLAALEAVHGHGIIHRDVKPSNVFLVGDRAVLADFGIAKRVRESSPGLTMPGHKLGTPEYMPPEQVTGEVTQRSDLYALGMVLFEAITGRKWSILKGTGEVDWSGVPRRVSHVLLRALEWSPKDRWPDARSFRNALVERRAPTTRGFRVAMALMILGLIVGVIAVLIVRPWDRHRDRLVISVAQGGSEEAFLEIERFNARGAASAELADSVRRELVRNLEVPDFAVVGAGQRRMRAAHTEVVLAGEVEARGDSVWIEVRTVSTPPGAGQLFARVEGLRASWPRLVADSLAYDLLLQIWRADSPLAQWLPLQALPRTREGLTLWLRGERLFAEARWGDAHEVYLNAEALDPTCLLCSVRIMLIERWTMSPDPQLMERVLADVKAFPPWYQSLIRASDLDLPVPARLDTLRGATDRFAGFYLGWFVLGDEVFHRGPLNGDRRSDAEELLHQATVLRRDFAPAWEHLAFVRIVEGDSAGAAEALGMLERAEPARDMVFVVIRSLLQLGFAWRFLGEEVADALTGRLLSDTLILAYPYLAAGPRWMLFFSPNGAVSFGKRFANDPPGPGFARSGLLAQALGHAASGRWNSVQAAAERLRELSEGDIGLFVAELEGAALLLDSDRSELSERWPAVRGPLERYARRGAGAEQTRRRAAWMLTLLARGAGVEGQVVAYRDLLNNEPEPRPLATLLEADRRAAEQRWGEALDLSEPLRALTAWEVEDPFFRTVVHLMRDEWFRRQEDFQGALRELRWHENSDLRGSLTRSPQPAEVDWAFGTLGQWRRARLLDHLDERGEETCAAYLGVARLWTDGEPRYSARADTARERARALGCDS